MKSRTSGSGPNRCFDAPGAAAGIGQPAVAVPPSVEGSGGTPLPWDEAPFGRYGMAIWRNGTTWPACRVEVDIPFIYAIVPARDAMQRPSIAEDQVPIQWRPFYDAYERRVWVSRTTQPMKDLPVRVQRKRTKGYRLPANTKCVTRPGPWSNHYYPGSGHAMGHIDAAGNYVEEPPTRENCVRWYFRYMETEPGLAAKARNELEGFNLACWCKLCSKHAKGKLFGRQCADCEPCHSDVVGAFANRYVCEELK